MTDKTEEKIAQERSAVENMRNAKSNMEQALSRISTLENALRNAAAGISCLKGYIGPNVYAYPTSGNARKCHDVADEMLASIAKVVT